MDCEKCVKNKCCNTEKPLKECFDEEGFHKVTGDHYRDYEDYEILNNN